ncbi:alginate lyase family protein [Novosphingobium sp. 9]|uniref:alginate lyase family protein n=1 Tax=Novosphingobium sp. 9 TaxID=2025349 RepID=UPI0021B61A9F|nr:alginate lyase family protein [Novosphingobium sp. 9]
METVSKYGEHNKTNSTVINAEADAQYLADTAPVTSFANAVTKRADHYVEAKSTADFDASCALEWLDEWARGNALLGKINRQGESVRKWELGTFATTFLKISHAHLDPEKQARVVDWLHKLAIAAKSDFSRDPDLNSRKNNHLYWAGWSVAAAGIATGDRSLLEWGMDCFRTGVDQIRDDGTLPLELARRNRAASYHMFAMQPLIMLAEAGETNGISAYAYNDGRLKKLIDLNLRALADKSVFQSLTGFEQEPSETASALSWMEPYFARFHDARLLPWLSKYRPMNTRRTGGDITALYAPMP